MWETYFIRISIILCILLGLFLILAPEPWFPDFYHPLYFGIIILLSPFLVALPQFILRSNSLRQKILLRRAKAIIACSLLVNIGGELGLYQLYRFGFEYDKFAHFLVLMFFSYVLAEILLEWRGFSALKNILFVLVSLFVAGIVWEAWEAFSDIFFGTHEWGVYGDYLIPDTIKDIIFNTLGILAGLLLFFLPQKKLP